MHEREPHPPAMAPFRRDARGSVAIEYGLIAGIVAVALIALMPGFSGAVRGLYDGIATAVAKAGA